MQIKNKVVRYDLSITDKELMVLMECIKCCDFSRFDCRDQSLAYDLLNEFEELFPDDKNDDIDEKNQDEEIPINFITLEDSESPYQGIFDIINNAINNANVVTGEYADAIRQEIMRKPSDKAIQRNKKAQILLRKLRGN